MKSVVRCVVALAVAIVAACGPMTYELRGTELVTGADAVLSADVKKDQNLTQVEFTAKNLPPPDRLKEGLTTYVLWQRRDDSAQWSRIGALNYDADRREGTMTATVPELAFDFEVTAEQNQFPESPSAEVVYAQRVGG